MKKDITHQDVARALQDVHPEHHFKVKDGSLVKNLHGLYSKLLIMDDATFGHHVTEGKNDFYAWILHIIRDEHLAEQLSHETDKDEMIKIIRKRLDQYHEVEEKHTEGNQDIESDDDIDGLEEKEIEIEQLKRDLEDVAQVESMGAGQPLSYQGAKDKLHYGFLEFLQGMALGILIGIFIARAIL